MKKHRIFGIFLLTAALAAASCPVQTAYAEDRAIDVAKRHGYELDDKYQPAGSIITEINTGQILWAEDAQVSWAPASMTKLMVILIAYDAIAEGRFSLDTEVAVTDKYVDIGSKYALSNNRMQLGASYSVAEMMDLIVVPSSAAATFMLADMIEPDQDKFVELMNKKAALLGMVNTTYYNIVGVPNSTLVPYQPAGSSLESYNLTSPEDYALLCSHLVKTYPDILNHTKYPVITVKEGTSFEEHFDGHHASLPGGKYPLEGTDGLKTGSSGEAGFNYSSTAKQGDTRLIEIVMGVSTWDDPIGEVNRHLIGNAIMEEAFAGYEYKKVLTKGRHTINNTHIELKKDFWDCVPKGQKVPLELKNGKVKVALERNYLPGYKEPQVSYETVSKTQQVISSLKGKNNSTFALAIKVFFIIVGFLVLLMAGIFLYFYLRKKIRRWQRRRRRKKRGKRPPQN